MRHIEPRRFLSSILRILRDLYRRPASALGTSIVFLFILLVLFGPILAPYGPNEQIYTDTRQPPSLTHFFGTDLLGRDIFSRIVHGARSVLSLTGLGALMAVVAGTTLGLLAGFRGGWLDEIIMRIFDSLLAIPALLFALVILGVVGPSRDSVLAVIAIVYTPIVARVVRSETLALRARGFVESARLRGESTAWILFREILPSVLPALSVEAALRFSYGIFLVASLGYLGVGVRPPTPDWGLMIREAREAASLTPWALYFPAGAISLLVISINLLADGLKQALQTTGAGGSLRSRRRVLRARRRERRPRVAQRDEGPMPILSLEGVAASYDVRGTWRDAVRDVSFDVYPGETMGLVGESGSGKTSIALAVARYMASNGAVRRGAIRIDGRDIHRLGGRALRRLRGPGVALVPQDPLASLNPSIRVGEQIAEVFRWQMRAARRDANRRTEEVLERVRIADPRRVARQYPHQLSGGMQQRIAIAMGIAAAPRLLMLDEPTTGLDVTTEARILDLVGDLLADASRASLYISHDLGVVARVSDRVAVLYAGELIEVGPTAELFDEPRHPYTIGLLNSIPRIELAGRPERLPAMVGSIPALDRLPDGCIFRPRCPISASVCATRPDLCAIGTDWCARCHRIEQAATLRGRDNRMPAQPHQREENATIVLRATDVEVSFPVKRTLAELVGRRERRSIRAVDGLSIDAIRGETVALVGESGSGKTTFARALLGLAPPSSGTIELAGRPVSPSLTRRRLDDLRQVQAVDQSPEEAFNPYRTMSSSIARPLIRLHGQSARAAGTAAIDLLRQVGLSAGHGGRLPSQLSGGEKQRAAIARAFAAQPAVVLCDEATSSLDVSVQALVLNLLEDLQAAYGGSYLFITHDLAVAAHVADRIAVAYLGRLMEIGPRDLVLAPPYHPYTEALLTSFPGFGKRAEVQAVRLEGEIPSPVERPPGCPFHTRCPRLVGPVCWQEAPPWRSSGPHRILCHIPLERLSSIQKAIFGSQPEEREN